MSERAWVARLANIGVHSIEAQPRVIPADATIRLAQLPQGRPVPLTDGHGECVGTVLDVRMTALALYAYGIVTDDAIAHGMQRHRLAPSFALLHPKMTAPGRSVRVVTAGSVAEVRALTNPLHMPGQQALWSNVRFTVEDVF